MVGRVIWSYKFSMGKDIFFVLFLFMGILKIYVAFFFVEFGNCWKVGIYEFFCIIVVEVSENLYRVC